LQLCFQSPSTQESDQPNPTSDQMPLAYSIAS
jgi:hypothetical protein